MPSLPSTYDEHNLPTMYRTRAALNVSKWQANQDLVIRQLDLTPAEGWPGKNEEQRNTSRDKTFAADEQLRSLSQTICDLEHRLGILDGDIQAAEAERRSEEWRIRARLCDALESAMVMPNARGDRAEAAIDDIPMNAIDQAMQHALEDEEIPF